MEVVEMGKLHVSGQAKQKINADMVNFHLRFRVLDKNSTKALYDVTEQCEHFLGKLKEAGFDLSKVRLADDNVEHETYTSGKPFSASRSLEFDMPLEIKKYNMLLDMIRKEQYEISIRVNYYVSNIDEVMEYLIKEAVLESQKSAEKIAAAMGKKVAGCEEINVDRAKRWVNPDKYGEDDEEILNPPLMLTGSSLPNSDYIGSPLIEEEKTVFVTWIID